ncbi:BTAD domain-containing putative transcriptional regulator [Actinomadura vinacea]|uniref:BTAD domain-containing putative transcriptional regulator n=1 Tax=Actinomadura vinacea TaxID=115336 RepID=A0ABN3K7T7_9ACTN
MRIGILGPLEVRDGAGRPVEIGGPRLRALLVRLALDAGRWVTVARLLDDLWDGAPPAGGGGNALQALVSRLRAAAGRDLVEHGPAGYRLRLDPADVDAVAFERAVLAARTVDAPGARAEALRRALKLWRGAAFDGFADAPFASGGAARLEKLRVAAVEDRVEAELAAGADAAPLVPELEALAAAHPLRERTRALLMRALYAAGRQADALRVYEEIRRELADGLGVDPSPELASAHLAILRQDTGAAPRPAAGRRRTNLPAQFTSFVGREEESARLEKLLRESRLVTLTGPGGAGKTRLAAEAVAGAVDELPDGVWFVPLAPVTDNGDGADAAQAALTALEIPEPVRPAETRSVARPLDRLADALATRRMLLVLDNCEHLLDAAALVAGRVLAAAPGVRILATSREPLGITGESLCPVPSLPLPPPDAGAAEVPEYDSVRLFADRAAAVRPGFAVDEATAPRAVEICRALDGIPLAIELAAARLRSLTPDQVAARLGDRFRLLTAGSRTALPRHRTLRAVVDWSWELLDGTERAVLRRLSVFAGGATPEAAARVCGLDLPGAPDDLEVIDVVAALVDKSLVMAEGTGEVRYRLLETIRVYAAERLGEAGEADRVGAEHAAFFLELAERAEPELRRADQLVWSDRLAAERGNWQAAIRHAVRTGDVRTGLRFFRALMWFWMMRDQETEAGVWATAVLDTAGDAAPPGLEEAYAMCTATVLLTAQMRRDSGPTLASLRETIETLLRLMPDDPRHPALILARPGMKIFSGDTAGAAQGFETLRDHPDPWVRAISHGLIAHLAMNDGDFARAVDDCHACYDGFLALGDRWGMVMGLSGLMQLAMARDEPEDAVRYGEQAHAFTVEGVSPEQGASMLIALARARARTGDLDRARADLERGIREAERIGEYANAAQGYFELAEFARRDGDLDAAWTLLERVLEMIEPRRGRPDFVQTAARASGLRACLAEQHGDLDEAARRHAEAFREIADSVLFDNHTLAGLVTGRAALEAARGDHARAAELLGTARGLRGYDDPSDFDTGRTRTAALAVLGEEAFTAAFARGRHTTRDEALAID